MEYLSHSFEWDEQLRKGRETKPIQLQFIEYGKIKFRCGRTYVCTVFMIFHLDSHVTSTEYLSVLVDARLVATTHISFFAFI